MKKSFAKIVFLMIVCMAFNAYAEDPPAASNTAAPVVTPPVTTPVIVVPPAPVPKKTIAVLQENKDIDDLISDADIILIDVDKAPRDAITEASQIVGKAPRRLITANQPIRLGDLKPFYVIKRGDIVTIQLQTASMDLSITGKALDNGAKGDTVRVTNLGSNRTIFAKATGPNTAIIEQK